MKSLLPFFIPCLAAFVCACSGTQPKDSWDDDEVDLGVALCQAGKAMECYDVLKPYAYEEANPKAMTALGIACLSHEELQKLDCKGVDLLTQAAQADNLAAQIALGDLYFFGEGDDLDIEEGLKWLKKAAKQGDPNQQLKLGLIYFVGDNVEEDPEVAEAYFLKAANQGSIPALMALGLLYDAKRDLMQALEWYEKAQNIDEKRAHAAFAEVYQSMRLTAEDIQSGVRWIRKGAEAGEPEACIAMAQLYLEGIGVPRQELTAIQWAKRAADAGDSDGQLLLGFFYYLGLGIPQSFQEALRLFQQSADQGNLTAQWMVGLYSLHGLIMPKETEKAIEIFRNAANQGGDEALEELYSCYHNGIGVLYDEVEADRYAHRRKGITKQSSLNRFSFFRNLVIDDASLDEDLFKQAYKAAERGDPVAQWAVASYYEQGIGVKTDVERALIYASKSANQRYAPAYVLLGHLYLQQHATDQAMDWFEKGVKAGLPEALYMTGKLTLEGQAKKSNVKKGLKAIQKAADQGVTKAQIDLAYFYSTGTYVPRDDRRAFEWAKKAADSGSPEAQKILAAAYDVGLGVEKDKEEALRLLQRSAIGGNSEAQARLGVLYLQGNGVPQKTPLAFWLLRKAEHQGSAAAAFTLAQCYAKGIDVTANAETARWWLERALDHGHPDASRALANLNIQAPSDIEAASNVFNSALIGAGLEDPVSQRVLGEAYAQGIGTVIDLGRAWYWIKKAADQGDAEALYDLGCFTLAGNGVPKDKLKAKAYLEAALKGGFKEAAGILYSIDR